MTATASTPDLLAVLRGEDWTVECVARALDGPLAALSAPAYVDPWAQASAENVVRDFIKTAPANLLAESNVRLRHELGVAKFTRLHELIAESRA
jgi:hypothetical protein